MLRVVALCIVYAGLGGCAQKPPIKATPDVMYYKAECIEHELWLYNAHGIMNTEEPC